MVLSGISFSPGRLKIPLTELIARRQKCQSCDVYDFCQGGCSIDAYYETGLENNGGDSCRIYHEVFSHVQKCVDEVISEKKDLSNYNAFVRDAILGRLVNPALNPLQ